MPVRIQIERTGARQVGDTGPGIVKSGPRQFTECFILRHELFLKGLIEFPAHYTVIRLDGIQEFVLAYLPAGEYPSPFPAEKRLHIP